MERHLDYVARNVPRYTSYPTAPHFTEEVNGAIQATQENKRLTLVATDVAFEALGIVPEDVPQDADDAPSAEPTTTDATPADDVPVAPAAPRARKSREGSKQARLIEMLKRPEGVTISEAAKALEWQSHTVRGAIAGALKKKLGLTIDSENVEDRGRV